MDFQDDTFSPLDITRENGPLVEETCRELMSCLDRDHLAFAEYQMIQLEQLEPSADQLRQYLPEADAAALIGVYELEADVHEIDADELEP